MRARLVGYGGERPPVPGTEIVVPIDPNPDPPLDPDDPSIPDPLTVVLEDGVPFHKLDYLAMGYNRFDVMCIGGGGGRSGGYHTSNLYDSQPGTDGTPSERVRYHFYQFPAGGGGGGVHRIKGRLALLPTSVPVVVGAAGEDGEFTTWITDLVRGWADGGGVGRQIGPIPTIGPGSDGGASSFGGVICRASGGKGAPSATVPGSGGLGNAELAGGGAGPHENGMWDGRIGAGGAGGVGGVGTGGALYNGGSGTPGAYSTSDVVTRGPGGSAEMDTASWVQDLIIYPILGNYSYWHHQHTTYTETRGLIGGSGGGATPFLLNGENVQHGSKAGGLPGTGLVIIRLTYVIT